MQDWLSLGRYAHYLLTLSCTLSSCPKSDVNMHVELLSVGQVSS